VDQTAAAIPDLPGEPGGAFVDVALDCQHQHVPLLDRPDPFIVVGGPVEYAQHDPARQVGVAVGLVYLVLDGPQVEIEVTHTVRCERAENMVFAGDSDIFSTGVGYSTPMDVQVLILGAGAMGRWFGRTLRDHADPTPSLGFADTDAAAARTAAGAVGGRAIDPGGDDRFDVVALAVPIPAVETALAAQAHRAKRAVCDVVGVMEPAVSAAREHAPDRERASYHPLFSPTNAPGNVAVVRDRDGELTGWVDGALRSAGNRLVETTPEPHDRAMGTVQARAHAAILSFALAAEDVPAEFATPVFEGLSNLVDTVGGGDPRVYADVQTAFPGAEDVAAAAEQIARADREEFERLYREAGVRTRPWTGTGTGTDSVDDGPDERREKRKDR